MSKLKYRYIGKDGAYVVGVPARDLTEDDDAEALAIAEENSKTQNPCYEPVAKAKVKVDEAEKQ